MIVCCIFNHGREIKSGVLRKNSGVQGYGRRRRGPGGGNEPPPPDAGEFSKIWKIFLKKISKIALS